MRPTLLNPQKKNLLLAFDAFGTLYTPNAPIPTTYTQAALRHGINCSGNEGQPSNTSPIKESFGNAFREESKLNPNYGRATGLGAERWWGNIITKTMQPFLKPSQQVPEALITELLTRFSTSEGYHMYADVLPFFQMVREKRNQTTPTPTHPWKWDKTITCIITNSDSRVPNILKSFGLSIGARRVGTSAERSEQASLDEDVSFVVLSYDVGYEKPDWRMFDAATQMLGETLAGNEEGLTADDFEKVIVGDSLRHDYLGAEAAGWDAVYLDRKGDYESRDCVQSDVNLRDVTFTDDSGQEVKRSVYMARDLSALKSWRPKGVVDR